MAANGQHIWQKTDDMELLRSAGLFGTNHETGKHGLNLVAVLLLGRDDVIKDVFCTSIKFENATIIE